MHFHNLHVTKHREKKVRLIQAKDAYQMKFNLCLNQVCYVLIKPSVRLIQA